MPYVRVSRGRPSKSQEHPLVFIGGVTLAAIAGFINVVVLGFFHVPVSHMTGAVSRLSLQVSAAEQGDTVLVVSILGGFLLGATLSGVIIGGRIFVPGRRYGVALFVEGGLLAVSTALLRDQNSLGVFIAATACGVQNAMASSYYGLVIRTTHVTGIVTDIGVMIGHFLRHGKLRAWRLLLLLGILVGFFAGGAVGAVASSRAGVLALSAASAACLAGGAVYFLWWHTRSPPSRTGGA